MDKEKNKKIDVLGASVSFLELLVLAEAVPAVDRAVCLGLERHFAFFTAVCACCLVHLARAAEAATALSVSKCHV